ncbi:MAG: hypothetical protein ACE5FT_04170 [Candidatus Nanoarchaeia archaeon]
MREEVAYGFAAVLFITILIISPDITGLGLWDPQPEVTLIHGTPAEGVTAVTRQYLKTNGVEIFRSRLYIEEGVMNVPHPKLGRKKSQIIQQLEELEAAGQ